MKRLVVICLATLAFAKSSDGHTLDEYVQALRVEVDRARLALYLDLTPGTHIVALVLERIDGNRDGVLSPTEAETYGRSVLADLAVTLDSQAVPLSLMRVDMPVAEDLRGGQGTIRIQAAIETPAQSGRHRVVVLNRHLPALSAYLANALLPRAADIRVLQQKRDERQQTFWLDYEVRSATATGLAWLFTASVTFAALVCGRRGSTHIKRTGR